MPPIIPIEGRQLNLQDVIKSRSESENAKDAFSERRLDAPASRNTNSPELKSDLSSMNGLLGNSKGAQAIENDKPTIVDYTLASNSFHHKTPFTRNDPGSDPLTILR